MADIDLGFGIHVSRFSQCFTLLAAAAAPISSKQAVRKLYTGLLRTILQQWLSNLLDFCRKCRCAALYLSYKSGRIYIYGQVLFHGQSFSQALYVFSAHHLFPPLSSPHIVLTRCPRVPVLLQAKIASLDDAGFYDPFHAERARQGADKMNNISKFRF